MFDSHVTSRVVSTRNNQNGQTSESELSSVDDGQQKKLNMMARNHSAFHFKNAKKNMERQMSGQLPVEAYYE